MQANNGNTFSVLRFNSNNTGSVMRITIKIFMALILATSITDLTGFF